MKQEEKKIIFAVGTNPILMDKLNDDLLLPALIAEKELVGNWQVMPTLSINALAVIRSWEWREKENRGSEFVLAPDLIVVWWDAEWRKAADNLQGPADELVSTLTIIKRLLPDLPIIILNDNMSPDDELRGRFQAIADLVIEWPERENWTNINQQELVGAIRLLIECPIFEMTNVVLPNGQEVDLFQAIVEGQKRIDVRLATEKYLKLRIGDIVIFKRLSDNQTIKRRIVMISDVGRDVSELLFWVVKDCGIRPKNGLNSMERAYSMIIPGVHSLNDLGQCLNQFPGYQEKIKQYGLIAFALGEVKDE